jgi:glucose/arabinose dehydrogenase
VLAQEQGNEVRGHAFRPAQRPFSEARFRRLEVPPGFEISVFARDAGNTRMMAVGPDGTVYVTRPEQGDVLAFTDPGGTAEGVNRRTAVANVEHVHGIAIREGKLYLASVNEVLVADLPARPGAASTARPIVRDLPSGGQHANRTLHFGPDGALYVSIGSTCNSCQEPDAEHAAILKVRPDGSSREVFARGLRNTIGFTWHPQSGAMWGMDHGSDWLGDDKPPEELNRLEAGKNYGWPYCYGNRVIDPNVYEPRGTAKAIAADKESYCAKTEGAVLTHQAHTAPIEMLFYSGAQFPAEYRNDAFVALRGSWNRRPAIGYEVARIRFENGEPKRFEPFLTGFLIENGEAQFGRVAGLAVAKDGSLLVSDDQNGMIYRVSYGAAARKK